MKKKIVVLFVLLVVLVSAFAGCGAPATGINGKWYDEAGLAGTIEFKDGGKCALSAMGVNLDAEYTFDAAKGEGMLKLMGQEAPFTLKDGKLLSGGTTYTRTEVKQQGLEDLMEGLGDALEGLGN